MPEDAGDWWIDSGWRQGGRVEVKYLMPHLTLRSENLATRSLFSQPHRLPFVGAVVIIRKKKCRGIKSVNIRIYSIMLASKINQLAATPLLCIQRNFCEKEKDQEVNPKRSYFMATNQLMLFLLHPGLWSFRVDHLPGRIHFIVFISELVKFSSPCFFILVKLLSWSILKLVLKGFHFQELTSFRRNLPRFLLAKNFFQ